MLFLFAIASKFLVSKWQFVPYYTHYLLGSSTADLQPVFSGPSHFHTVKLRCQVQIFFSTAFLLTGALAVLGSIDIPVLFLI